MNRPPNQVRRKQQRAIDTRAAIKAAGADLFAARGFGATGVRDIAERARCNQAMIAYHFGGKGGLYDEILADAVVAAQQKARAADFANAPSPERELVRILSEAIGGQRHLAPMLLREQLDPDRLLNPETASTLLGFMELTESVLAALPLDSEARGWDPQIVHLAIVGPLIHFTVATQMREAISGKLARPLSTPTLSQFTETLAEMVARSLRASPP